MSKTVNGLEAPEKYWELSKEEHSVICNGGGPKGWGWLVPDTMWGLSMTKAFDVHDFDYFAKTPKATADDRMYRNIQSIIACKGGWLRHLRYARAWTYFTAVSRLGGSFY
jgi:hypothetical protein